MKKIKYLGYTLALLVLLGACEQDTTELTPAEPDTTNTGTEPNCTGATAGSANFSKFVAIGNSLTSGFQAGALFTDGQANSLSKILATQFTCVGGSTTFNQPDIKSTYGYYLGGTNPVGNVHLGRLFLQGTPAGPAPYVYPSAGDALSSIPNPSVNPAFMYTGAAGSVAIKDLNNFGVPMIQLGQALITQTGDWSLAGSGDPRFNPYYARFASNPGNSTILGDAMTSLTNGGTFFSFWLGNNDVLGYALTGGTNAAILTSPEVFTYAFNTAISTLLTVPNVKGVVGNIPAITAIPYFTKVAWNAVVFDESDAVDAATVQTLNAAFSGFNKALQGLVAGQALSAADAERRKVQYGFGANPILIFDETLEDLGPKFDHLRSIGAITAEERALLAAYEQARPMVSGELVTLAAGAILGKLANPADPRTVYGVAVPLGDNYTLSADEVAIIQERTSTFNTIIANQVANSQDRIALADVYTKFNQLATARAEVVNGVTITPDLAPPAGGFSEDGIHPNNRGYAYVANIFIDAINTKFGATVPKVNLSKYTATALPINP